MTLPTIAYLLQEFFDGRDDRRMPDSDSRQTFSIGQPGKLVQVPGDAFELGHEIQLFAGDPCSYRSSVDQLAQDFGRRLPGLAAKGRESEFPFGAESCADDVFADVTDADFRAPALFAICFFRCFHDKWFVSIFCSDQRDFTPASGKGGVFVYENTTLPSLNLYPFPTRWFNFLRFRFQGLQIIPTKVTLPVGCRFREIRPVFYMGDQIVIYVLVKLLWSITSLRGQRRIRSEVVLRPASSLSKKA